MQKSNDAANKYSKLLYALFIIILVAGLILRFYQHFMGRSLWEDETHFALNFMKYDFWRLTKPLDDIQAGPIFFLWGVKAFVEIFGYNEVAFRMLTWLTCILTLPLFYFAILELTQRKIAALLGFLLFSVNASLLYFSSELKPYGIDVSAYVFMTYLTISRNDYVARNRNKLLMVGGCLAILLSNTAFIAVFCSGVYMLLNWYRQKKIVIKDVPVMAVWAIVFLANYFIFIHNHPATTDQRINYAFGFFPTDVLSCEFIIFLRERLDEIFFSKLLYIWNAYYISYVILAAFVVATWRMLTRKEYTLILFTWVPILITLGLSAAQIYPFWFRLILFLVPCFIIILAYGTYLIAEFMARKLHFAVGALFLLVCTFFFTKENFKNYPLWPLEIKPSLDYVNKNVPKDMHIYMSTPVNAYTYYYKRGQVNNPIYKNADWELTPGEFYEMVAEEKSNYVFFYGSSYPVFGYKTAVEDFHQRGLVVDEFEYGGYMVSILKPLPEKPIYTTIAPASFDSTAQGEVPLWGGDITSRAIDLPKGKYEIVVVSKGTRAGGAYPQNSLHVNGNKIGDFTSPKNYSRSNAMAYEQKEDGQIQLRIHLENDAAIDKEDRNTFITKVLIYQAD